MNRREQAPPNRHIRWSWADSLGNLGGDPTKPFRVKQILFGLVRDRCRDLGLQEGIEFRCRRRTAEAVLVEIPGGRVRVLELPYAWFVAVEAISPEDGVSGDGREPSPALGGGSGTGKEGSR